MSNLIVKILGPVTAPGWRGDNRKASPLRKAHMSHQHSDSIQDRQTDNTQYKRKLVQTLSYAGRAANCAN